MAAIDDIRSFYQFPGERPKSQRNDLSRDDIKPAATALFTGMAFFATVSADFSGGGDLRLALYSVISATMLMSRGGLLSALLRYLSLGPNIKVIKNVYQFLDPLSP